MKLTAFSVRHWQFTVIMFVMLAALGYASWTSIPRLEDPPIELPSFTVVVVYPGASPAELEELVVTKLEEKLDALDDVKKIDSRIRSGVALTSVEFEENEDPDRKYDDVVREVNALRPDLPQELTRLDIDRGSTLDVNIVQVALVSPTASYRQLDEAAKALEDRLQMVPGVRQVERWGAPKPEVQVSLDLGRLAALDMPPAQVLNAIGGESADLPGGIVESGHRAFNVQTSGSYETLDEVRDTVVRGGGGRLVHVGDVADVAWGYADSTYRARYNGERAVFVTANQKAGVTIQSVRNRIYAALDEFQPSLPAGIRLERGFDQAENVSERLGRLGEDFGIAIALVLLTLLPLGVRAAGIVMISIPLSLAIGVTALKWTGYTMNQLTIVGLVIALGLLVDDSIVVVENISRFRREGHSPREAAIRATGQIWVAVLGATGTLLLSFVPLLYLPGGAGRFIRSLPMAVIFAVLASLAVSLTVIPWLATILLPRRQGGEHGNRFLRAFEAGIHRTYAPLLDRALRHRLWTLAIAAAIIAGSFALVPVVGFSLFPKAETPRFRVDITAPVGASIAETDSAARYAEHVLAARPEVKEIFTSLGHDNPMIYYNVMPRVDNPRVGQLFVLLHDYDQHRTPALLDTLRTELAAWPGPEIALREFEQGPPIDAPIALRVEGPSLDSLRVIAGRLETLIASTPGTQYVTNPLRLAPSDLRVAINREKAGLLGIPSLEVDRTVRLSLAGLTAGTIHEPDGDERDITVILGRDARPGPDDLGRVYVSSLSGRLTPLAEIADLRFETAVPEIQRRDRVRSVTVTSDVRAGYSTDRVTRHVLARLGELHLPAGYRIAAAGEIESRQESFGGIGSAILVSLFAILAILVLEFRTFRSTLIVASVIPLGIAGGIVALFLSHGTLSFTATIGFAALIGIEIKTSILLVDLTNQLRAGGMELDAAIRRAGEVRFLPIVLTSLTAIGGLLPLAVQGSAMYSPLAWVIIGGLVSSTLLARIVTPVMYRLIAPRIEAAVAETPRMETARIEAPRLAVSQG